MGQSAQDRSGLTHLVLRSRHGRYDIARTSLPLCAFDLAHKDSGSPKLIAREHFGLSLDALAREYFPQL